MLAKELMNKQVVTVPYDLPLTDLAKVFEQRCISGAPVVDEDGTVMGVVSQTDLVLSRKRQPTEVGRYHVEPEMAEDTLGLSAGDVEVECVEDIMTPGAIAYDENVSIKEIAQGMLDRHIHRVLITRGGKLAGILTTSDLLRALIAPTRHAAAKHAAPARRHGRAAKKR